MVRSILKYLLLFVLVAVLAGSIMYANMMATTSVCESMEVFIENESAAKFINKDKLLQDLKRDNIDVIDKLVRDIDLEGIEQVLNSYDYLESAECAIINNQKLLIKVEQIIPLVRIFDGDESYYLNKGGKRIKADYSTHIDLPIVYGNFNDEFTAESIIPLAEFIMSNETRLAYVTMINAKDKNNIFILPVTHGHVINIGNITELDSKFEKIKLFYKEIVPYQGWYTYDTISVKWDYQIVASRRVERVDKYVDLDVGDEPETDFDTMSLPERE